MHSKWHVRTALASKRPALNQGNGSVRSVRLQTKETNSTGLTGRAHHIDRAVGWLQALLHPPGRSITSGSPAGAKIETICCQQKKIKTIDVAIPPLKMVVLFFYFFKPFLGLRSWSMTKC
jgi:hypothetical protein